MKGHRTQMASSCLLLCTIMLGACGLGPASRVLLQGTGDFLKQSFVRGSQAMCSSDLVVIESRQDVYAEPSAESVLKGTLIRGDQIKVLAKRGNWLLFSSDQFRVGWIIDSRGRRW